MNPRVLIVDDEQNIRRMLGALLEQHDYDVHGVSGGAEAPGAVASFAPDVILMDLVMPPGPDGIATLEQLRREHPNPVVIMMSGKASLPDAVRATQLGAFQFLEKPLTPEGVLVTVKAALDLTRARAENRELRTALQSTHSIMGKSAAIEGVRALVAQVAPTPSRVLITGESGTGKELVANAIHTQSERRDSKLVSVNCAAIPRELIESEMFGHERGAFTGAVGRRVGKFELAHRGTLFLDEVGDLALDAQAKLLRVLETGTVERVGGDREIAVDVRVVAATNKDLDTNVKNGSFREDLFYRLNVFPIHVPPLRERREDAPRLVAHFAARVSEKWGRPPAMFTPEAVRQLTAHSWPGNVRELANIVERLTIIAGGEDVTAAHVVATLGPAAARPASPSPGPPGGLSRALQEFETDLVRAALRDAGGNVAEAARRLDTDRANLYRRMRRLGVDPNDTPVSK
jgi:two-component system nitrogen regulation response regulator NtrX